MIKVISNKTIMPKITIQSKVLQNKSTVVTPTKEGKVSKINKDTLIFVKAKIDGLLTGELYGKITLVLVYEEPVKKCEFQVIRCSKNSLDNADIINFANGLTGDEIIEDRVTIPGDAYQTDNDNVKTVSFDVTNIAKQSLGNNPLFTFVIKTNYEGNDLTIYNPEFTAENVECCTATTTNFGGINSYYKFDKFAVGNIGTGYVNLFNQTMHFVIKGLTSLSKNMPISYFTTYNVNKSNEKSLLDLNLTPSFQYKIELIGNEYLIEDATGNRNYYKKVDTNSESGKELIDTYNIKHLDEDNGDLYFSNISNEYFFLKIQNDTEMIKYYDQSKNIIYFEVSLKEPSVGNGRFTKIIWQENKFGDQIIYTWSGIKLVQMKNTKEEIVDIDYDTNNRITHVYFNKLKQFIEYTYKTNEWRINIAIYNGEKNSTTRTLLEEVQLNYEEFYFGRYGVKVLSNVEDKIIKEKLTFDININGIVSGVSYANSAGDKAYSISYSNNSLCTTKTLYNGQKTYYYFDLYGKCKLELDAQGRSVTYNYDELENGESTHLNSVSSIQTNSRNLLENNSFEYDDSLFNDSPFGWKKTGDTNSIIKSDIGGVYGYKYLSIEKAENEIITISQDVVSIHSGVLQLTGFVKYKAKKVNEKIAAGDIKIKISGTYTLDEEVVVNVDSVPAKTEIRPISHYYSNEIASFSGFKDWMPFSLSVETPEKAYNITMKVELILSGVESKIGLTIYNFVVKIKKLDTILLKMVI